MFMSMTPSTACVPTPTEVTEFLPAVAGFLMENELDMLGRLLANPESLAIIGGAKVSDKIAVLSN